MKILKKLKMKRQKNKIKLEKEMRKLKKELRKLEKKQVIRIMNKPQLTLKILPKIEKNKDSRKENIHLRIWVTLKGSQLFKT